MSLDTQGIFGDALSLPADTRGELVDKLLESLGESERKEIDEAWAAEVEARLQAYEKGAIDAVPGEEVFDGLLRSRKDQ